MSRSGDQVLRDFSPSALAAAVKGNLYTLFDQFRQGEYTATSTGTGWYAWRTGLGYAWFNGVRVEEPAEQLTDDAVDAALRLFARYDGDISWRLAPGIDAEAWRARLARRGLNYEANTPGMAIDLGTLDGPAAAQPSDLEIHVMTSAGDMQQWSGVFVRGYGLPDDWQEGVYNVVCTSGLDLPFRHYLGVLDGEAVATSSLLLGAGVAGVHYVATLPTARKRGIGAAMTRIALEHGRSLGYRIGVLQSSQQGFPVYRRMGFAEAGKVDLFVGRAGNA